MRSRVACATRPPGPWSSSRASRERWRRWSTRRTRRWPKSGSPRSWPRSRSATRSRPWRPSTGSGWCRCRSPRSSSRYRRRIATRRSPALARRSTGSRPRRRSGRRSSTAEQGAGLTGPSPDVSERLRELPSVEELAASLEGVPHETAVRAARAVIGQAREAMLAGGGPPSGGVSPLLDGARAWLAAEARPHLRRVINATGVIVHTNLGRAPLADAARDAVAAVAEGYSNLEYDA